MKEHKILIIGAGPAGLETAYQLKNLGLTPIIIERSDKTGGHLAQWDRLFPSSDNAENLLESFVVDRVWRVVYKIICVWLFF